MKLNATINRQIFFELIPPFVICMAFLTFIVLMAKILDITDMVVNYKIGIVSVFLLLTYYMSNFMQYLIPMTIMLAVLLTFLRMSSDNEIIALKTSGINVYHMLPPVLIFCFIGCLLSGFISIYGEPWGARSLKKMLYKLATTNINIGLKERTFNDGFKGVTLYVAKNDNANQALEDVFIEDQREAGMVVTVVAPKGKLVNSPESLVSHLRLYDGIINQVNLDKQSIHNINFKTYDFKLDRKSAMSEEERRSKRKREMSIDDMLKYLKDHAEKKDKRYYLIRMKLHKKFSIPFSCIALGFLAMPLGMMSRSARRSYGLGLGLVIFLFYYLIFSAGLFLGEIAICPAVIATWLPNIVMAALGIYFFKRTAEERPISFGFVSSWMQRKDG